MTCNESQEEGMLGAACDTFFVCEFRGVADRTQVLVKSSKFTSICHAFGLTEKYPSLLPRPSIVQQRRTSLFSHTTTRFSCASSGGWRTGRRYFFFFVITLEPRVE